MRAERAAVMSEKYWEVAYLEVANRDMAYQA